MILGLVCLNFFFLLKIIMIIIIQKTLKHFFLFSFYYFKFTTKFGGTHTIKTPLAKENDNYNHCSKGPTWTPYFFQNFIQYVDRLNN